MGWVMARHFPNVNFIGYEFVKERVEEVRRCWKGTHSTFKILVADLSTIDFAPAAAEYYFIYDFGSRQAIEKTLQDLRKIAQERPITVVGRGRASRDAIERQHPWLSQMNAPEHFGNYSIYRS